MPPVQEGFPATGPVGAAPREVDVSFWLWVTGFVLGLIGLFVFWGDFDTIRDTAIEEASRQAQREGRTLDEEQLRNGINAVLVGGVVIGLIAAAVQLLIAWFMRKGRNWARIVLTVLGVLGVFAGLFSLPSQSGSQLGLSAIHLLVLAGAVVAMYLPAANAWFRPPPAT